jgi:methylmalonyl-CoA/ethylmalonyl-CoA epimerase
LVKVKRIDHIAIVVDDIEEALGFWRDALGLEPDNIQEVPGQYSEVAFLPVHDSEIELVQPTTTDSGIARYLERRGPGMHHLCLEVEDINSALEHLRARGVRLINEVPQSGAGGKKYAFIHPESASGVLVELYQLPKRE